MFHCSFFLLLLFFTTSFFFCGWTSIWSRAYICMTLPLSIAHFSWPLSFLSLKTLWPSLCFHPLPPPLLISDKSLMKHHYQDLGSASGLPAAWEISFNQSEALTRYGNMEFLRSFDVIWRENQWWRRQMSAVFSDWVLFSISQMRINLLEFLNGSRYWSVHDSKPSAVSLVVWDSETFFRLSLLIFKS